MNITENIELQSIDNSEIVVFVFAAFKYAVLVIIAFFAGNLFGNFKPIFFGVICLVIVFFFLKETRFGLRAIFEKIFRITFRIILAPEGIYLYAAVYKKMYNWADVKKIVPEIITDLNEYKINIITRDARVIRLVDDSNWTNLEVIKNWSENKTEITDIFEHASGLIQSA